MADEEQDNLRRAGEAFDADLAKNMKDAEFRTAYEKTQARLAAAGKLTGVYPPGYLDKLRDEWE